MPRRSYEAIRKQIEKLEAQARKLEETAQQKKKQAVAQVVALMKKLGVSLEDMAGARPRRTRAAKGGAKKRAAKKGAPEFDTSTRKTAIFGLPQKGELSRINGLPSGIQNCL